MHRCRNRRRLRSMPASAMFPAGLMVILGLAAAIGARVRGRRSRAPQQTARNMRRLTLAGISR